MPFPICLNSNTYHGFGLADAMHGAAAAGITHIELASVAGWTEHVSPDSSDAEIGRLLAALDAHGLRATALGGHANLTTAAGRRLFRRNLLLGARLGVDYVVTGTGETHGDEERIGDEAAFVAELAGLAEDAARAGVRIAVETHGANYPTGAAVARLVEQVGSAALGIAYDTGNTIYYGGTEPYDDLAVALPRVTGLHLKDKAGEPGDWDFPAIGTGTTDMARVLAVLAAGRSEAVVPLSIEVEFTPAGPSGVAEVHRAVQTSVATLRALGHVEGLAA